MKNTIAIHLTLSLGLITNLVSALDESPAKEMACVAVKHDPDFKEMNTSATNWYFPMWSQLAKYRMAAVNLGKSVADVTEADLVNDCENFSPTNGVLNGFHNAGRTHVTFKNEDDGAIRYDNGGKLYILKSDSEYRLDIDCWDDNQASWMVVSTKPTISAKTRQVIIERVKSLGFDMNKLVDESYDHCDDEVPSASTESLESSEENASIY